MGTMNRKLDGRAAIITGASRGIGMGIAKAYLREGARVFLCARGETKLRATAEELGRIGPEVGFYAADVSDPIQAGKMVEEALARFPDLSILVNNASILGKRAPIVDVSTEIWDDVLRINTSSLFYVTRPLIPALIALGEGSIINVSSSVGRKGKPNWGPYAVSKFGLEGFTQVLAEELRPHGVRVNSVNPGGTRTDMRANAYPEEDPMSLPTPEDIAPVFVYLASDESKSMTGLAYEARDYIVKK
jgi:NAD(P)-dependent dehydrogenase (short-subunit alcohol dehydrogenase family)